MPRFLVCYHCLLVLSLYQFVIVLALFWTDLLPSFGMSSNLKDFGTAMKQGAYCLAQLDGCSVAVPVRASVFVGSYVVAYW